MLQNIQWLGHASFKIKGKESVIYIDPFKITGGEQADIIIITHEHFDHLSPDDIKKIIKPSTVFVATPDCASKLKGIAASIKSIMPFQSVSIGNIKIEAIPSYNINKNFHPKSNNWIGVVINIDGKRIYHAGDTDFVPEMKSLKNIDVALLPVSGTYVMTAEEATYAANFFMPKIAVPMHYGSIIGSKADAEIFKKLCRCNVEIMEKV